MSEQKLSELTPFSRSIDDYYSFNPDVIVEVTNACDRACAGCYAPNILTSGNSPSPSARFLTPHALNSALHKIGDGNLICFRGGEPSIHPNLDELFSVAKRWGRPIILETHGRWIKADSHILEICKKHDVVLKLSFDSMHGISEKQLSEIIDILEDQSVRFLIAITESSFEAFLKTRALCLRVNDAKIIFQKKATHIDELIRPLIGVIKTDGTFSPTLTTKETFQDWKAHA